MQVEQKLTVSTVLHKQGKIYVCKAGDIVHLPHNR